MRRPVGVVTTAEAAEAVGMAPASFRRWARDRGLRALAHVRVGRSTVALWDLDGVFAAEAEGADTPSRERVLGASSRRAVR